MALFFAVILTVFRPTANGILGFGTSTQVVRAAPGVQPANRHNLTALSIFNVTLVRVRDSYVDPQRIDPKKMLFSALDSVQFNIPEVLVEAFPQNNQVVVSVNNKKRTFSTKEVDSPWRLSKELKRIFGFIEANVGEDADLAQVEYAAVNGMLNTLDPHSVLLDPETARDMDVSTTGKFGGLGIEIRMIKRKLTVVRPMKGTPAFRAGLQRGDHIVKIDKEVTENLSLNESVERMRGEPNTPITIWVKRKGIKKTIRVNIVRDIIRVASVESQLLDSNVGYLRLKHFSGTTAKETRKAMDALRKQGATAWVVDLRRNPGGLLDQAIRVSDIFVKEGTLVTTVGGRERDPRKARSRNTDTTSPVAVLVGGHSASASEIVAGAIKNLDRGIVIGDNTFGKGSVQVLYNNRDGSKLKLTVAEYLTPGDLSIQSVGIQPDIELHRKFVPKTNTRPKHRVRLLKTDRNYREKDLDAHLTSRYQEKSTKPAYELGYLYIPPPHLAKFEEESEDNDDFDPMELLGDEFHEDFEIQLAKQIVSNGRANTRTKLLQVAQKAIVKNQQLQRRSIASALQSLNVDWQAGPLSDGKITVTIDSESASPNNQKGVVRSSGSARAGDVISLRATVTNTGKKPAYQVHLRSTSENPILDEVEFVLGVIPPGTSKQWVTKVKIMEDSENRFDPISFSLREGQKLRTKKAATHAIRIQAQDKPVFAYSHQLIDLSDGNGLVSKNEQHELRVTIKNIGKGAAKQPTALLRNNSGDGIVLKKARFELDALAPGASKTVRFLMNVTDDLKADSVSVEMTVYDGILHESISEKLRYDVVEQAPSVTKAGGFVAIRRPSRSTVNTVRTDAANKGRQQTAIRQSPTADSEIVAWAARGATFKALATVGNWKKIELAPGRPAFVLASTLRVVRNGKKLRPVVNHWQVTPPTISVEPIELSTKKKQVTVSGFAQDDTKVEDIYIFVSNYDKKVQNRKVSYKSNRGAKDKTKMHFSSEVPLWPGSNKITIIVRENDKVRSAEAFYINRLK